jgi:hypothetical protein
VIEENRQKMTNRAAGRATPGGARRAFDPGLLLVGLLVLLAVSPLFPPGLPSIADAPIHLFRTMELVSCWADGVIYPRWAPNLAFGYGYPMFDFAPPLPHFIAGVLHVFGFSLETSIKLLAMLCLASYGLGMYLFTRNILGGRGALLAAAAYIHTPFRFREILLYGGNYPQILAIGLFPWVLWAFERIVADGRQRYIVAGAICYGALLLSHNFHAFIFTPLLILYIAMKAIETRFLSGASQVGHFHNRENRFLTALRDMLRKPGPIMALSLGLVLTAFFWAPALHDLGYTTAQTDYYLTRSDFRLRLLSPGDLLAPPIPLDGRADNPYVPFSLGVTVVPLAALGVVYLLFATSRLVLSASHSASREETQREILHLFFFLLVLLGASFMMLRPAAPLWENLPFLPYAEFPWRLMGIANLGAAFLAGGSIRLWERLLAKRRLADLILAASLLALILGVAVYFYPVRPFLHWGTPSLSDYVEYEVRTQNVGTTGLAEYLPRWAEEIPTSSPLVGPLREGKPLEKLDRSALPAGVQATALAHDAVTDHYHFRGETDFRARFFTFYFPGWQAFLDGEQVPIQIIPPLGLMAVDVPAGEHELLLRFRETPFRLAMDAISMIGLIGLAGWWLVGQVRRRGERRGDTPVADTRPAGLTWGQVWPLGTLLVLVFAGKVGFVDPHTNWFRRESPPGLAIGVEHPMHVQMEDNVLFLGYDLVGKKVRRAGELLQVRLYWQATGPLSDDYVSFIHLDAPPDNATFATADNFHPGDPQAQNDVPSLQWSPALYVRDEHRLVLPDDMPPIAYSLRAGLYERRTGRRLPILPEGAEGQAGDTIFLQQIHTLLARSPQPGMAQRGQKYRLGENIELLGHSVEIGASADACIQSGQMIAITLYWQALTPVEKDYTVFVHLLDGAGQVRAQHDSSPMNGRYPTNNWLSGQVVKDKPILPLPPDLPPGEYHIAVGMYELATGERLTVRGKEGNVPNNAILLEPVLQLGDNGE